MEDCFSGDPGGVIGTFAPAAHVIRPTHGIAPGDVQAGAFNLRAAFRCFPEETDFVAVMDPGVGGPRDALLELAVNGGSAVASGPAPGA